METLEPRGGTTAVPETETENAFDEMEVDAPRVGIIMGSASDKPALEPAEKELQERGGDGWQIELELAR